MSSLSKMKKSKVKHLEKQGKIVMSEEEYQKEVSTLVYMETKKALYEAKEEVTQNVLTDFSVKINYILCTILEEDYGFNKSMIDKIVQRINIIMDDIQDGTVTFNDFVTYCEEQGFEVDKETRRVKPNENLLSHKN